MLLIIDWPELYSLTLGHPDHPPAVTGCVGDPRVAGAGDHTPSAPDLAPAPGPGLWAGVGQVIAAAVSSGGVKPEAQYRAAGVETAGDRAATQLRRHMMMDLTCHPWPHLGQKWRVIVLSIPDLKEVSRAVGGVREAEVAEIHGNCGTSLWSRNLKIIIIISCCTDEIHLTEFRLSILTSWHKLDLAFNNVKPKDWYFVLDSVRVRTELGCVRLTNQNFWLNGSRASFLFPSHFPCKS